MKLKIKAVAQKRDYDLGVLAKKFTADGWFVSEYKEPSWPPERLDALSTYRIVLAPFKDPNPSHDEYTPTQDTNDEYYTPKLIVSKNDYGQGMEIDISKYFCVRYQDRGRQNEVQYILKRLNNKKDTYIDYLIENSHEILMLYKKLDLLLRPEITERRLI